jgi:CCR4-NOT transcription complex subunit 4
LKAPPGVLGPKKAGTAAAAATASPLPAGSGSEAKKNIKALAVESGLAGDIASQASKSKAKTFLQEEDFPALDTPKTVPATVATPSAQQKSQPARSVPAVSKRAEKKAEKQKGKAKEEAKETEKDKPLEKADDKPADKTVVETSSAPANEGAKLGGNRPVPGILNIAAATKVSQSKPLDSPKTTDKAATDKSAPEKDSAFPALPTPSTASVFSPVTRAAPKTLRVVSTPKIEVPSITLPGSVRSAAANLVRPETPGSEIISDSTSVVSAGVSLSRTSSPPPSRVGTAPLRTATKSQQRKARKEAVKKDTEAIATPKPEMEVEIAPILGRKKKQKKEKTNTSSNVTPTESRPETPVAKESASTQVKEAKETKEAKDVKDDSSAYRSTAHETMSLTEDKPPVRVDAKGKGKDTGEPESAGGASLDRVPAVQPTPSSVFQKLIEEGAFPGGIEALSVVKPITGINDKHRHDQASTSLLAKDLLEKDLVEPQTKSIVNEEDQAALLEGKPVRKLVDGLRVMLSPYGDCVRNLAPEEEDRFLALQERVAAVAASPAAFVSPRHEPTSGFSLIKGRAVPNGPPTFFPRGPGAYPQDPVNKIQREEAIYYINQYVLPRINLGTTGFPAGTWKSGPPNALDLSDKMLTAHPNYAAALDVFSSAAADSSEFSGTVAPYIDTAAPELSYPAPAPSASDHHHHHHHHHANHHHHQQNIASVLVNHLGGGGVGVGVAAWPDEQAGSSSSRFASAPGGLSTLGGPFAGVPLMSLEDAEQALAAARKETEKLEKTLNQTIKKNRKLLVAGGVHGQQGGGGGQGISAH